MNSVCDFVNSVLCVRNVVGTLRRKVSLSYRKSAHLIRGRDKDAIASSNITKTPFVTLEVLCRYVSVSSVSRV